jgi:hypothetical protein
VRTERGERRRVAKRGLARDGRSEQETDERDHPGPGL